ncbi:MAG: heavy metal translocating P-type ATPase [Chitinophagaceae bacterium]
MIKTDSDIALICSHCGEDCDETIRLGEEVFCCEGCKQVYLILHEDDRCDASMMATLEGVQPKGKFKTDKWDYLDEPSIAEKLIRYQDEKQVHLTFKLPNMHCASCIWLLEHLQRINKAVLSSKVDFEQKEVDLVYTPSRLKLSELSSLLEYIGYPPLISFADHQSKKKTKTYNQTILRIGVAGFCFSNIMMLSFPDYLASNGIDEKLLTTTFSYISLVLSIPVLLYAAAPFFVQTWKGLRQKFLNIDAPIALAIIITFARSVYEILADMGTGYLDSMSGIIFFMLLGRWFQEKTERAISFDRDYKSYFPMSSLIKKGNQQHYVPIEKINTDDILLIRNQELIPTDALLIQGKAMIDYSFVTGEKDIVLVKQGQIISAGGKQMGAAIELKVVKPVAASQLTKLWNNEAFHNQKNKETSFIHPWGNYFSIALFTIAITAGIYWQLHDSTLTWKAVTSILIVACPCSLLLSATFTFGNLMRIFGKQGMYLKNANVIERLSNADTIVFDKTGTLTTNDRSYIQYHGKILLHDEIMLIKSVAAQSSHPLSRRIASWDGWEQDDVKFNIEYYEEFPGKGIEAEANNKVLRLGKIDFVAEQKWFSEIMQEEGTSVHVSIDGLYKGRFHLQQAYREEVFEMINALADQSKEIHILSGDNDKEQPYLEKMIGKGVEFHFNQNPSEKLSFIASLQSSGKKVIMVGDGLNDAGALQQSDVGIAVTDQSNYFTPACDAILKGTSLKKMNKLLKLASSGKTIVAISFALSIAYNVVGMYFSTQALLSPLIAAILMPASTISIILLTFLASRISSQLLTVNR